MSSPSPLSKATQLCRGRSEELRQTLLSGGGSFWFWLTLIWIAGGIYGFTIGIGRSPLQAGYTAIKFPMILTGIIYGNALLNALIASLLNIPLQFRQTLQVMSMCFALFTLILAALSPVFLFFTWNLPDLSSPDNTITYSAFLLFHVCLIAFAGCAAHLRLFQLTTHLCGDAQRARWVLILWLSGNLLLGSQLSWNLRPFFGSPELPVQFFRPNAFERNFFEAVDLHVQHLINPNPPRETHHEQ